MSPTEKCLSFACLNAFDFVKRIITAVLLLLLIVWSGGLVQVSCLRILARLKAANITSFESPEVWVFSEDDLRNAKWEEEGKEFILSGRMFDVLYVEAQGRTKTFHCYFDHFETKVTVAGKESDQTNLHHPLPHKNARDNVPLLSLDLFFESPELYCNRMKDATEADFLAIDHSASCSAYLDIPPIPPEFLNV